MITGNNHAQACWAIHSAAKDETIRRSQARRNSGRRKPGPSVIFARVPTQAIAAQHLGSGLRFSGVGWRKPVSWKLGVWGSKRKSAWLQGNFPTAALDHGCAPRGRRWQKQADLLTFQEIIRSRFKADSSIPCYCRHAFHSCFAPSTQCSKQHGEQLIMSGRLNN